ncbi:MAG: exonuclease SbcC [Gammaproteobacteria bacterium]|jgi:exonuclease SbcC
MKHILPNLFKPAWQSPSVEKRLSAIAGLQTDNKEHQQVLLQLASEDADDSVRIAAMQRLADVVALNGLSIKNADSAVGVAVEKRLDELMTTGQSIDEAQYRNLLASCPELQVRIATHANFSSIRTQAIQNLLSEQLLDVLGATIYTDCRQLISEQLLDIEDLESARKIMRGKDKNAERIIKAKIDTLRQHERELAENKSWVEKLIEEVEYLAAHDWLPEFQGRYRAHRQQWDNLAFEIEDEHKQRYQLARKLVDSLYQRQQEIERTRQSQGQLAGELEALLKIITARDIATSVEVQSEMQSQLQQTRSSWQALEEITAADQSVRLQYRKMFDAIQSATQFVISASELIRDATEDKSKQPEIIPKLDAALKNLEWSNDFSELQVASEVRQQLQDWRNELRATAEAQHEKLAKMHKNISSIFRFSHSGNLTRAKQVAQKVQKTIDQFDGKDLLALQERFDEASKALGDMGDWKNFSTEPKYIELCEAMELLTASKQHADRRTSEMKALQQQWKALGHSDVSEQYWPRFKLAADQVYQSCAAFFEQRHGIRKANLEQRKQYLDEMRELLESTDWDNNPDYKAVQSSIHSINSGFSSVKDIERNAGEKQWKQYSTLRASVMVKLDAVYDDNIATKQRLIKQAETLAEATVIVENLTHLKSLQTRWKMVGVTRRGEDQKAWKVFKKQGDIVYNKVQELRQSQRNETDQQLDAYRNIIKSIQQLAKTANDLAAADHQFSELQTSYDALPELPQQLPEKLLEDIQRDYHKACDQFDNGRSRIIKGRHNRQHDALRQKASLCTQLEALAATASEQQLQEISQQWDAIELHNAGLSQRIEARRASAQSDIDRDVTGAERRMLCIRLEILMDIESPSEDRALRMKYQLQQMNQSGLGQQVLDSKQLLENMEFDWLCMPGAKAEQQVKLDERFQRVLGVGKN